MGTENTEHKELLVHRSVLLICCVKSERNEMKNILFYGKNSDCAYAYNIRKAWSTTSK